MNSLFQNANNFAQRHNERLENLEAWLMAGDQRIQSAFQAFTLVVNGVGKDCQ